MTQIKPQSNFTNLLILVGVFFIYGRSFSSLGLLPNLMAANVRVKVKKGSPALLRIGPIEVGCAARNMIKQPTASQGHLCLTHIAIPITKSIIVSIIGAKGGTWMPMPSNSGWHACPIGTFVTYLNVSS
jgi:hypothetical protein